MNIIELVKKTILGFAKAARLPDDPASERYTFINDPSDVASRKRKECRIWYVGDSNELLNYYTERQANGSLKEPIYDRNRRNYFWALSSMEANIKRVHSGVPRMIVDTLVNAIGTPKIECEAHPELQAIIEETNLQKAYAQEQLPLTMAEGWGAWKIVIDPKASDMPIAQFYEAEKVDFAVRSGRVIGIVYRDFYSHKGKDYVLLETRRINENGDSAIEYALYRLSKNGDVHQCELSEVPELEGLQNVEIRGLKAIMGVPCRFLFDPDNPNYGRSIYDGKIDLFDDLDQSLSQRSRSSRLSTPVEYIPSHMLDRGRNGTVSMPQRYDREYVQTNAIPDGDGRVSSQIQTTQPSLNFQQYTDEQKAILDFILTGILSPATMGMDVSKKDNADAQREKEKVTIMTRNSIIAEETRILKELCDRLIWAKEYMDTGSIDPSKSDVSVKFPEFASPSFESKSQTLLPMLTAGGISTEMYVDKLYGDGLSDEEKAKEIQAIDEKQSKDDLSMGDFDGIQSDGDGASGGLEGEGIPTEPLEAPER